ncbi:MAG TPA: hypothetical protein VLK82_18000 [Candidatus Tectomicrobia bacterium]|nr:hypothetical protein [Candidatus Tectomicrobia bacterium]
MARVTKLFPHDRSGDSFVAGYDNSHNMVSGQRGALVAVPALAGAMRGASIF